MNPSLRIKPVLLALAVSFLFCASPVFAAEKMTVGGACSSDQNAFDWDTGWQCVSSVWARAPFYIGSASSTTCSTTYAGMLQYNNNQIQACDGTNWNIVSPHVNNAGSAVAIDWSQGTTQYTSASCGSFTFTNMIDGNSYQLFIEGTTSGTCSFSQTGLTFKYPSNHGATTASTMTAYSFTRAGSYVFITWIPGY